MQEENTVGCGWGGISVEFGEKRTVESIPDVAQKFRECKLPMSTALLGYQYFYESRLSPEESIFRALSRTLTTTGTPAQEVQMLMVSSADVDFLADRQMLPRLLRRLELSSALPLTITSQECTGLLSAIDLAHRYIQGGPFKNILVVSCDRARDDSHRIKPFGVVSDAVVACLVSSAGNMDFALKGFSHVSDVRGMQGDDDFSTRKSLTVTGTDNLFAGRGGSLTSVKKVFSTNFFRPVAKYNASTLGLAKQQLDVERALEFGHCLCADPLINLCAYFDSRSDWNPGDLFLLQAYAPGFLASMLIERLSARNSQKGLSAIGVAAEPSAAQTAEAAVIEQAW